MRDGFDPPPEGEGDRPQGGGGVSAHPEPLTPLRRAVARHLPSKGRIKG
jgi:hypothetical protein